MSQLFFLVKNIVPPLSFDVATLSEGESLQSRLCEYAGPATQTKDIPALAVSWVFESVEDGAITLPEYVRKVGWSRDRPICGLPRLEKFQRVGVHVDSCRQVSAFGHTQKCSCQEMISVEDV